MAYLTVRLNRPLDSPSREDGEHSLSPEEESWEIVVNEEGFDVEQRRWTLDMIGAELKFFLLQLAGILYGSFARYFSPLMSLFCLIALLSMHAVSNDGIMRWNELRVARGWRLCDLLFTKFGEVILLSMAVSWQLRFSIDIFCALLDKLLTHWIGYSDRVVIEFIYTYCTISPLRKFEFFCHVFFLYYLIILLNALNNMPLD